MSEQDPYGDKRKKENPEGQEMTEGKPRETPAKPNKKNAEGAENSEGSTRP